MRAEDKYFQELIVLDFWNNTNDITLETARQNAGFPRDWVNKRYRGYYLRAHRNAVNRYVQSCLRKEN